MSPFLKPSSHLFLSLQNYVVEVVKLNTKTSLFLSLKILIIIPNNKDNCHPPPPLLSVSHILDSTPQKSLPLFGKKNRFNFNPFGPVRPEKYKTLFKIIELYEI